MQMSDITVELIIFAIYLAMVVGSYHFLTRVFLRMMDPNGEYKLTHGIPLPGLVRWLLLCAAFIIPMVVVSLLAAVLRMFV
jgi:hypothetical protein